MTIKDHLIACVKQGALTNPFTTRQFYKILPPRTTKQRNTSYCALASFEPGQVYCTHTRYLIRIRKGIYKVHPDALK